jgi:Spy/CpxP family protein refolding chaperone
MIPIIWRIALWSYARKHCPPTKEIRSMYRLFVLVSIAASLAVGLSPAQSQQPYAGLETRPIKALSEQQIADLRAGRGMGLALAAELNGYPGPLHVLELADRLSLSDAQRATVQALLAAMKAEAVPLGETLIAREADLDRQFADKTMTPARLEALTDAIGAGNGALRRSHLKYHLLTRDVLTAAQAQGYAELRGYAAPTQQPHGRHQPH